jgi:hypothetical protein
MYFSFCLYFIVHFHFPFSVGEDLQKSQAMRGVLELILAIGNYLNGRTAQGGVYGFKLDVLSKVGLLHLFFLLF